MALVVKSLPANAGEGRGMGDPWVRKAPWRRAWQRTAVFLVENPTDRGARSRVLHRVRHHYSSLAPYLLWRLWAPRVAIKWP